MLSEIPFFGTAKNSISLNRLKPIKKAGKSRLPPQLFGHTQVTIPLLNSVSLASHDMRKTWYSGSGVYGAMLEVVRRQNFRYPE